MSCRPKIERLAFIQTHGICEQLHRPRLLRRAYGFTVIELKTTLYRYCEIDPGTVAALLAADSNGMFDNQNLRSPGSQHRPFDCRDHSMPAY